MLDCSDTEYVMLAASDGMLLAPSGLIGGVEDIIKNGYSCT